MSKLYILNNNKGLVKIGITDDSVESRLKSINKDLLSSMKFSETASFEVEANIAKIESIIHDFLNQGLLNISYLKEKINIVEFDSILNNKTEGYTEMFLSNPSLIKNILFFLGYSDLINIKSEDLDKINNIKSFDFDYLYNNYQAKLIDLSISDTQSIKKITNKANNSDINTLLNRFNIFKDEKNLTISLSENGELLIKNSSLSISNTEMLFLNDEQMKDILNNKNNTFKSDKSIITSLVKKFHSQNKEIRKQSKLSVRKEIKKESFYDFFTYEKQLEIKNIMDINSSNLGFYFPDEILFSDHSFLSQKLSRDNILYNDKDSIIIKPNFSAKLGEDIFKKYINASKQKRYNCLYDGDENTKDNVLALGDIFKILYDSEDKEITFNKIIKLMKSLSDYSVLALWQNEVSVIFKEEYRHMSRENAIKHTINDINELINSNDLKKFCINYLFAMDNSQMYEHQHKINLKK